MLARQASRRGAQGEGWPQLREALAIGETRVPKHFQERMPYGCSCRTFREEPVTTQCVGWAGPSLSVFLDGFPTPPELYLPFVWPRAGFLLRTRPAYRAANRADLPPSFWNIRLYGGVTFPQHLFLN
jgi:hypothetical protein